MAFFLPIGGLYGTDPTYFPGTRKLHWTDTFTTTVPRVVPPPTPSKHPSLTSRRLSSLDPAQSSSSNGPCPSQGSRWLGWLVYWFFSLRIGRTLQWKGGFEPVWRRVFGVLKISRPLRVQWSNLFPLSDSFKLVFSQEDHPTGAAENHAPKNGQEENRTRWDGSWGIKGEMCPELLPMLC